MGTIREETRGKLTLRLVEMKGRYAGVVISSKGREALLEGDNPDELWRRLEQEAARSDKSYFGFAGARARFLNFFPDGFVGTRYVVEERDYKLAAKAKLDATLPLGQALDSKGIGDAAWVAFRMTNLLSPYEMMRVKDLLHSTVADSFVRGAARFATGQGAPALAQMAEAARAHNAAKWTTVTYLPFLWRPDAHMFLKPEVTKDFAARVGHPFIHAYQPQLDYGVYESLLDMMQTTRAEIADLGPRDYIDIQSFVWTVGAYTDKDTPPEPEAEKVGEPI